MQPRLIYFVPHANSKLGCFHFLVGISFNSKVHIKRHEKSPVLWSELLAESERAFVHWMRGRSGWKGLPRLEEMRLTI